MGWYDRRTRQVRDLSCGDTRIDLEIEVRRVQCRSCGKVKRERIDFPGRQPVLYQALCALRGAALPLEHDQGYCQGTQPRLGYGQDAGKAVHALAKAGTPGPKAIGIDEISIRKGHTYRIVVSDLIRRRPIWFGGEDRSEKSMAMFYEQLGHKDSAVAFAWR